MYLTLEDIANATSGEILAGDSMSFPGGFGPGGIAIDTRNLMKGQWFIALKGKTGIDGHEYIGNAIVAGAAGLIISDRAAYTSTIRSEFPDLPVILVPDTTRALADMARAVLDLFKPIVIAITGTVGKTTVKENIAHVTSTLWPTLKNPHNWNTEIGVPLTVFNLTPEHQIAILECASRGVGQIHDLSIIARPSIAVITSIGPGHLSEFGSIDTVAKAKWEIVDGLRSGGTVIAPGDSPYTKQYGANHKVITFGMGDSNDFHPEKYTHDVSSTAIAMTTPRGTLDTSIPGISEADIQNALCTVATCLQIELPESKSHNTISLQQIASALQTLPCIPGRNELIIRPSGIVVIFDAYNSNPMSLKNALEAFARTIILPDGTTAKRRVAVLGDMLELGTDSDRYHTEIGSYLGTLPIDCLITVGKSSKLFRTAADNTRKEHISGAHFANTEELARDFAKWVHPGDIVLLKASRGIALEKLLDTDW
jgi:UDP-N-acetylmuramoyl-tripeptide--D-alanyl-D-alanine ligase